MRLSLCKKLPRGAGIILILFGILTLVQNSFSYASEADTGYTVQFVARGVQLLDESAPKSLGHAYIILGVKTASGVKEDIFGFYPTTGGRSIIKGPGMLKSEYRCGPNDDCGPKDRLLLLSQISKSKDSVKLSITEEQRRQIYKEINRWDSKSFVRGNQQIIPSSDQEYRMANQNCNTFIAAVAQRLGYPTPSNSAQFPVEFLGELRVLVEQEHKVREARETARKAKEAEQEATMRGARSEEAAAAANERANVAEQKAREAEEARDKEARRIPAGWVRCTCPEKHGHLGKWVNGALYHASDINCPR